MHSLLCRTTENKSRLRIFYYKMNSFKLFIFLQLFCFCFVLSECELEEFYRWKQLNIELPSDEDVDESTKPLFIPYSNVPMSAARYNGKIFITIPRRAPGIPSTLNYVPDDLPPGSSPSLRPYPDFKTNELHPELKADDNRIISIYRTRVDDCGRLWFVDTGALEENGTNQIQLPSLWAIDLNTDKVVQRFEIPETIVEGGRGIISLKIDVDHKKCDKAHAYISDFLNQKLYVYSLEKNRMWSFSHPYLEYELELTKYKNDGFEYQWFDGVFSVTLGKCGPDGYRKAYFHPMASNSEFEVNTKILQNESLSANYDLYQSDFVKIGFRGQLSQSALHDFDEETNVIFFSLISKNAISCWNSNTKYIPKNHAIVAQNDVTLNYPVDLRVDPDGFLFALTNTLPRFIYGKLDTEEYNFRLWRGRTKELIKDTVCEPRKWKHVEEVEHDVPQ